METRGAALSSIGEMVSGPRGFVSEMTTDVFLPSR
jgi:hypothetical protein